MSEANLDPQEPVKSDDQTAPKTAPKPKPRKKAARKSAPAAEPAPEEVLLSKLREKAESKRKAAVQEKIEKDDRTVYVIDCPSHDCKGPAYAVYGWPTSPPVTGAGLPMPRRFLPTGLSEDLDYEVRMNGYCAACLEREGVRRQVAPTDRLTRAFDLTEAV